METMTRVQSPQRQESVRRPPADIAPMHPHFRVPGEVDGGKSHVGENQPAEPWKTVLRRWIVGFLLATAVMWAVGALTVTELPNFQWDEDVGDYVVHGVRWHNKEGRGTVCYDDDGIQGAASGLNAQDKHVVLWGDSYVESLQVGDENAVYTRMTEMAEARGLGWRAVGVAQSGRNIVDHLRLLPAYAARIPNIQAHVVIASADDVLCPLDSMDGDALSAARKRANPPVAIALRPMLQKYRLNAFWMILSRYRDAAASIEFRPGPFPPPAPKPDVVAEEQSVPRPDRHAFWRRWASEFKRHAAGARVVVVYHSRMPLLEHGEILYDDPNKELMAEFAAICAEHGIGFVSLTDSFCDFTRRTSQFPRGFANSYPFAGHWNADGHRLAAEAICDYLCANK
jgi:hypothetical protein